MRRLLRFSLLISVYALLLVGILAMIAWPVTQSHGPALHLITASDSVSTSAASWIDGYLRHYVLLTNRGRLYASYSEYRLWTTSGNRSVLRENARWFEWKQRLEGNVGWWDWRFEKPTTSTGGEPDQSAYIVVPLWAVSLSCITPALYALLIRHRLNRRRHRLVSGLCLRCGYDLRGTPTGICPECGAQAAVAQPR